MYTTLVALGAVVWFTLGFWLLYPRQRTELVRTSPWIPLLILVATQTLPIVFLVSRKDGNDLLEEGLSVSNVINLVLVAVGALYCAWVAFARPGVLALLRDRVMFPYCLWLGIAFLTAAWSIVPQYTVYRAVELTVMFALVVLVLDRPGFERNFVNFIAAILVSYVVVRLDLLAENLSAGIVFSSMKHNMVPALSLGIIMMFVTSRHRIPGRWFLALLALVTFVTSGSAATVGALPLLATGWLAASRSRPVRWLGNLSSIAWMIAFVVLMAALSNFPDLMETISVTLQKPVEELEKATGRGKFWPLFLDATADRNFGAGYAAGERFLQLLVDPAQLAEQLGAETVLISSSHNMLIGAWVAAGWVGLLAVVTCLALTWREGLRLDLAGRRFVLPMMLLLIANAMTTPGPFGEFNLHTLLYAAILVFIRVRQHEISETATVAEPVRNATASRRARRPRYGAATA